MNTEDRAYLEVLKRPPLSIADEWLIARLEDETKEVLRLMVLATEYSDERITAEIRCKELEAENSILRGLSQKATIDRGSFAEYTTDSISTSEKTRATLAETEEKEN